MTHILKTSVRWLFTPMRFFWGVFLYPPTLTPGKSKINPITKTIQIQQPQADNPVFKLYIPGFQQTEFSALKTDDTNNALEVIPAPSYYNFFTIFSLQSWAEAIHQRITQILKDHPTATIHVLAYSLGGAAAVINLSNHHNFYTDKNTQIKHHILNSFTNLTQTLTSSLLLFMLIIVVHCLPASIVLFSIGATPTPSAYKLRIAGSVLLSTFSSALLALACPYLIILAHSKLNCLPKDTPYFSPMWLRFWASAHGWLCSPLIAREHSNALYNLLGTILHLPLKCIAASAYIIYFTCAISLYIIPKACIQALVYVSLWMCRSHQNIAKLCNQTLTPLLKPSLKIIQQSADSLLPPSCRLSEHIKQSDHIETQTGDHSWSGNIDGIPWL